MKTKLTLWMEEDLVRQAKVEAKRRGKSVSRMVGDLIASLRAVRSEKESLPPVTSSLIGILKGRRVSENEYRRNLRKKYG